MVEPKAAESKGKVYLVHFRQHWKHLDFARQELESLAELHGICKEDLFVNDPNALDMKVNPTVYVNLPSDEVCRLIMARSVLIKEFIDVFAQVQISRKSRERSRERETIDKAEGEEEVKEEEVKEKSGAIDKDDTMPFNYDLLVAKTDVARLQPIISQGKKLKFSLEGIGRKISMRE